MAPDLLDVLCVRILIVYELPDDIRKAVFGVIEERPEVVLPDERGVARSLLEGRRDGRGCGHWRRG